MPHTHILDSMCWITLLYLYYFPTIPAWPGEIARWKGLWGSSPGALDGLEVEGLLYANMQVLGFPNQKQLLVAFSVSCCHVVVDALLYSGCLEQARAKVLLRAFLSASQLPAISVSRCLGLRSSAKLHGWPRFESHLNLQGMPSFHSISSQ